MKKFVLLLLAFFYITAVMELGAQNQGGGGKILVAYFSHTGNTRELDRQIQQKTGADLFEIIPVTAYSRDNDEAHAEARRDRNTGRGRRSKPMSKIWRNTILFALASLCGLDPSRHRWRHSLRNTIFPASALFPSEVTAIT
jgi:hypothetical protein